MSHCPFCKLDPYEYVDVGVGLVPVAVTCCDLGPLIFDWRTNAGGGRFARRLLRDMRSHKPHAKARAMKVLRLYGLKPEPIGRAYKEDQ